MLARTALLLSAFLVLIVPAAAHAGSVRKEGSFLIYQGNAGATDGVRVTEGSGRVDFTALTANAISAQASAMPGCVTTARPSSSARSPRSASSRACT